ncbi:conserved hypothetical protein [Cupriavidus necator]|uniref:Uncharacterized protein n=1 Tax=Cupriavidus necator TaxID=106590 RepID=A0A1K0J4Y6_CUPNE|nr:conserved hypothetical protein [Cupriavidus necator]
MAYMGGGSADKDLRRQRVVAALAGEPGDSAGVKRFSQLSRSRISPAEHVGEQIGGNWGWRAAADNGGIRGPSASVGEGCGTCAQLASHSVSGASIRARRLGLLKGVMGNLRLCRGAALFLEARAVDRVDLCERLVAALPVALGILAPALRGPAGREQHGRQHQRTQRAPGQPVK